jgi:hypothetical protein
MNFTLQVTEDEQARSQECPEGPFVAETFTFERILTVTE